MTRLTEADVTELTAELMAVEDRLREATGLGLRDLALRTVTDGDRCVQLHGARVAAVPISSGQGVIGGFSACVVATLQHLGCDAWMTTQPDVRGMQAAVAAGAQVVFLADDHRFIALNVTKGCSADDDPATADGYVTALEAAAGGLEGREVLVLGLGPVGRAAVRRLEARGSAVLVAEPDAERIEAAGAVGLTFSVVPLAVGLTRCDLVFDASPAADLIDAADLRAGTIAAVPGMPSAFTAAAQELLGVRHIHEPLAIGVAVMAARALL
jgi:3-methylornithyl-N6-L-lysine dehydrogenase